MNGADSEHAWMQLYALLEQGAAPHPSLVAAVDEYRGPMGQTFLHWLCLEAKVEHIHSVVKAGMALDGQDEMGNTAMMEAAAAGRWDVAAVLLEGGASLSIENYDGEDLEGYLELWGVDIPPAFRR